MIIVAGGCSFIFGAELADQHMGISSRSTYPALIAKDAGAEYICAARSGNANNAISRMVMNQCQSLAGQEIFVIVQWTFSCRFEFLFNYKIGKDYWYSVNPWDNHDDVSPIAEQISGDPAILAHHVNHFNTIKNTGLGDFSKMFFKHVGDNEQYETYAMMKEVLFLQQYLKANNIKYLFTFADNHIHPENPKFQEDRYINDINTKTLTAQIDWDKVFTFPKGKGLDQIEQPRGFYQWAVENKYPVGTTHPLEEAHLDAAKLMQEKFNELVKKSI